GLVRSGGAPAAPAPRPAESQYRRRRDDRRPARSARRASRQRFPLRRAARCRGPAFLLRRQRRRAHARTVRGDAEKHPRAGARSGPLGGAGTGCGAWAMPRRWPGSRRGGAHDVRCARRKPRSARDEDRRVCASRVVPVAGTDRPAARHRPSFVRPQHQRHRGGCLGPGANRGRPGSRRAQLFQRAPEIEERVVAAFRGEGRALRLRRTGARQDRTGRAHLSRPTHAVQGRGRRPHGLRRKEGSAMAASLNGGSKVAGIVARAQALFDDLSFTAAREWKAAVPGRKVIGYMPIYVPRELIHAAGMMALGVVGGGDQMEVIHGDAYYQSYICRIPRSTIELGVTGRLDFVDGMLFPSICDVIRNLSGMWKMMFPQVYVRYFDVPQNYKDEIGGNYYTQELRELLEALAELRGKPVTDDELRHSISVYNENRRLVRELYTFRAQKPWQTPASEI